MKHQILVQFEDEREPDAARQAIKNLLDCGQEELDTNIMYGVQILNRKIKAPQLEAAVTSDGNLYLYGHGTSTVLEIEGTSGELVVAAIETPNQLPSEGPTMSEKKIPESATTFQHVEAARKAACQQVQLVEEKYLQDNGWTKTDQIEGDEHLWHKIVDQFNFNEPRLVAIYVQRTEDQGLGS